MSLEFDAPPLTRRERREREELLLARGATPEQAAELAAHTGVIDLGLVPTPTPAPASAPAAPTFTIPEPVASPPAQAFAPRVASEPVPAPAVAAVSERQVSVPIEPTSAPNLPLSRRELREQQAAVSASQTASSPSIPVSPVEPVAIASEPYVAPQAEPIALEPEIDVQVVEVVEQLFSTEPTEQETPLGIPPELGTETGPIHWTEALNMPVNLDPTDPASMPELPSFASDTNTIVLDEMPDITGNTAQGGEVELLVTGTILLPTELTETGALPDLIDSADLDQQSDTADEVPLAQLSPKSAAAAVNASTGAPAMIAETPKQRLGAGAIVAISAGGVAGVALAALAIAALVRMF